MQREDRGREGDKETGTSGEETFKITGGEGAVIIKTPEFVFRKYFGTD